MKQNEKSSGSKLARIFVGAVLAGAGSGTAIATIMTVLNHGPRNAPILGAYFGTVVAAGYLFGRMGSKEDRGCCGHHRPPAP